MIEFLNNNSGVFSVIFSFVVMLATVVYAILTARLVKETEKLRKVETDPCLSVYLEPEERWISFIDLIIQNNGRGAAYDVRFQVSPDFEYRNGEFLSQLSFMQSIKYLAPGQKIKFFLASAVDIFPRETGKAFKLMAAYKNAVEQVFQEEFNLDFEQFRGLRSVGDSPAFKIANVLEKIHRNLHDVVSGISRLKVELWTQGDIEKERMKYEEWNERAREGQEGAKSPPQTPPES